MLFSNFFGKRSGFFAACLITLATGLSIGCAESNLRDDKPNAGDDTLLRQARKLRSADDNHSGAEYGSGLSDRARDIEKDFGYK